MDYRTISKSLLSLGIAIFVSASIFVILIVGSSFDSSGSSSWGIKSWHPIIIVDIVILFVFGVLFGVPAMIINKIGKKKAEN